jgi:uncharacterized membrane protein YoaK (UPF0700 family)
MTEAAPLQMHSPMPMLLLILSVTTGMIDAISVLGLGKVFTANMTGNVVFLGFAAAGAEGFKPLPLAMALLSFLAGALIGGRAANWHRGKPLHHWLLTAAGIESLLIWAAALVALTYGATVEGSAQLLMIALLGGAMGLRNGTVRRLGIPDLTTTVLTMTLTGIAADSSLAGGANPNLGRRIGAVVALFVGAALGALLIRLSGGLALPLMATGAIVLLGTLAFARHPALQAPAK